MTEPIHLAGPDRELRIRTILNELWALAYPQVRDGKLRDKLDSLKIDLMLTPTLEERVTELERKVNAEKR